MLWQDVVAGLNTLFVGGFLLGMGLLVYTTCANQPLFEHGYVL